MSEPAQNDYVASRSGAAHAYRHRIPYIPKFFEQLLSLSHMTRESRVLDLCCGNGQLAIGLSKCVAHIDAVDGSAEMLDLAPKVDNVRYILGNVNKPQLPSLLDIRKFDHFVIGRAIHWVELESLRALSESCLKDKGRIIVAAAGWDRKTPWIEEFHKVRRAYGRSLPLDWRGTEKLSAIGFHVEERFVVTTKISCDIHYLVNHAASYSASYRVIRANLDKFRSDLARALQPYIEDGMLTGLIENSATIYRR